MSEEQKFPKTPSSSFSFILLFISTPHACFLCLLFLGPCGFSSSMTLYELTSVSVFPRRTFYFNILHYTKAIVTHLLAMSPKYIENLESFLYIHIFEVYKLDTLKCIHLRVWFDDFLKNIYSHITTIAALHRIFPSCQVPFIVSHLTPT